MKSQLSILFVAIILLLVSILFDINFLNYSQPIPHDNWKSITLHDFKGLKKPSETLHGSSEFAFIETNREINFLSENEIEITALFYPSRSYVFDDEIRSESLLRHELYHFHITEWQTRLLRKKISEYQGKISRELIESWNKEFFDEENRIQAAYDDESYHSYVLKEQKKWETNIDINLEDLSSYSNPTIHLKEPLE